MFFFRGDKVTTKTMEEGATARESLLSLICARIPEELYEIFLHFYFAHDKLVCHVETFKSHAGEFDRDNFANLILSIFTLATEGQNNAVVRVLGDESSE